jgi:SNF2 family DNA or RNA helicase
MKNLGSRVYSPDKKAWEVPITAIPTICRKLTAHDVEITGSLTRKPVAPVNLPKGFTFKTKPYNHQIEGVVYGLEHDAFLLGDDQGLGKTKQIIDIAIARKLSLKMKHCLIICGVNGNKYNWVEEVHIHSNEDAWVLGTRYTKRPPIKTIEGSSADKMDDLNRLPPHFFIVTNIEALRAMSYDENKGTGKKSKKMRYPLAEQIQKLVASGEIGMVAFDEAHKAKNPESQQGEALLKITPKYPIPMSGTFLVNHPLDLYLPLRWAGYETHNFYTYKQHYCRYGGFGGKEIIGYKNLDDLRDILSKVMLRRTKDEVLDLPPKVRVVEYIEMSEKQQAVYDDVKARVKQEIDKIKICPDPLAQLIRLRQATGHPPILSSTAKDSIKMERLEELVEDIVGVGQKAMIYSQWEQMTEVARQRLKRFNPAYITGNVKDRMAEVNKFQNDPSCKVIIGTVGAMGTGFTLTAASTVIFLDEPWNRALKDQAEDRAHRIGTKGTVRIITLICKDTIDERIYELVQKKGKMADMLIDGKMEVVNKSAYTDYLLS